MGVDKMGAKAPELALLEQSTRIDQRSAGQQWLKEWEAARGEALAKTRVVGQGPRGTHPQTAVDALRNHEPNLRVRAETAKLPSPPHAVDSNVAAHRQFAARAFSQAAAGAETRLPDPRQLSASSMAERFQAAAAEELAQSNPARRPGERMVWQPLNLHVQHVDGEVAVWLRDSTLRPDEIRSVLQRLERETARLGLRLHQLKVNGKSVYGGDADTA